MPILAWGNGGCATDPTSHKNLLIEIASYGYVIAADGIAGGRTGASQSMVSDMKASLDWAMAGGAAKYGSVNTSAIATMGHSCGGLEAMSTAYHDDRVKRIVMFNIGIFQDEKRYLLQEIKVPVAWFIGGPKDMGYPNVCASPIFFFSPLSLHIFMLTSWGDTAGREGLQAPQPRTPGIQGQSRHRPRWYFRGHQRRKAGQGSFGVSAMAVPQRPDLQGYPVGPQGPRQLGLR